MAIEAEAGTVKVAWPKMATGRNTSVVAWRLLAWQMRGIETWQRGAARERASASIAPVLASTDGGARAKILPHPSRHAAPGGRRGGAGLRGAQLMSP